MRSTLLLTLALTGCAGGGTSSSSFPSDLDALRAVVVDHADTMAGAGSLEEVGTEESRYATAFADRMTDVGTSMDGMMECMGMMEGDDDGMDEMHGHMDDMEMERDAHGETQAGCADLEACMQAEPSHHDAMMAHLDAMESWMEDGGGSGCGSGDMGM